MGTLAQLRTAVLQRADMENNAPVTTAEVNAYVNESMQALFERLVHARGLDVGFASFDTPTVPGQSAYDASAPGVSTFKLISVRAQFGNAKVHFRKINMATERLDFTPQAWSEGSDLRYGVNDDGVVVFPVPNAVYTLTLFTQDRPATLVVDADEWTGEWDEYIVVDSAIKCARKEQQDTRELRADLDRVVERIDNWAAQFDQAGPMRVGDVTRRGYSYGWEP